MVAKITTPNSIKRVLNYNEKKVQKEKAACIYAGNFLPDIQFLNFNSKLYTFKKRIELNTRAKTNALHISLNFDPSEKLSKEKLIGISQTYMEKIGFGNQPYLVYEHYDAGHPHIHIVTTTILTDGKRIDTYNIGKYQSEKARKEIEKEFQLARATKENYNQEKTFTLPNVSKIQYGKNQTKRSITNVLEYVLNKYLYTSIFELNAILKLYNLVADKGSVEGRIYKNHGLVYRILDGDKKVGTPIKASSIYFKPTLKFLEEKFKQNDSLRLPHKQKLKVSIDWVLSKNIVSLPEFILELQREKINTSVRRNEAGFVYGITFIDHRTKSVFNGSDLGKLYSAASIQQRLLTNGSKNKNLTNLPSAEKEIFSNGKQIQGEVQTQKNKEKSESLHSKKDDLLITLLNHDSHFNRLPYDFLKKKKKKRRPNR